MEQFTSPSSGEYTHMSVFTSYGNGSSQQGTIAVAIYEDDGTKTPGEPTTLLGYGTTGNIGGSGSYFDDRYHDIQFDSPITLDANKRYWALVSWDGSSSLKFWTTSLLNDEAAIILEPSNIFTGGNLPATMPSQSNIEGSRAFWFRVYNSAGSNTGGGGGGTSSGAPKYIASQLSPVVRGGDPADYDATTPGWMRFNVGGGDRIGNPNVATTSFYPVRSATLPKEQLQYFAKDFSICDLSYNYDDPASTGTGSIVIELIRMNGISGTGPLVTVGSWTVDTSGMNIGDSKVFEAGTIDPIGGQQYGGRLFWKFWYPSGGNDEQAFSITGHQVVEAGTSSSNQGNQGNLQINQGGNILISGGAVYSGTGMDFDVTALTYSIAGVTYGPTTPTTVTLANGSATNDRFDAIVATLDVNNNPIVDIIQGTPSATPTTPTITEEYVLVQYVLVSAGQSTPNIQTEVIYQENNIGWASKGTVDSTNNADFAATTVGAAQGTEYAKLDFGNYSTTRGTFFKTTSPVDRYVYTVLSLKIYLTEDLTQTVNTTVNPVGGQRRILLRIWDDNLKTTYCGHIYLDNYGIDYSLLNQWQHISVPTGVAISNPTTATTMGYFLFQLTNENAGYAQNSYLIDDVILQTGYGSNHNTLGISVAENGATIAQSPEINFVEGPNVNLTVTENVLEDRIDVEIEAECCLKEWEEDSGGNLIPKDDDDKDIGKPAKQVKDIFMTGATLYMGSNSKLYVDPETNFFVSGKRKISKIPGGIADSGASKTEILQWVQLNGYGAISPDTFEDITTAQFLEYAEANETAPPAGWNINTIYSEDDWDRQILDGKLGKFIGNSNGNIVSEDMDATIGTINSPVKDLFVSEESIWLGQEKKITVENGVVGIRGVKPFPGMEDSYWQKHLPRYEEDGLGGRLVQFIKCWSS